MTTPPGSSRHLVEILKVKPLLLTSQSHMSMGSFPHFLWHWANYAWASLCVNVRVSLQVYSRFILSLMDLYSFIQKRCACKTLKPIKTCLGNTNMVQNTRKKNLWIIPETFFKIFWCTYSHGNHESHDEGKDKNLHFWWDLWKHMWEVCNTVIPVLKNHSLIELCSKAVWNMLETHGQIKRFAWHMAFRD